MALPADDLLLMLQSGLPLEARPFQRLGAALGLSEADVLDRLRALFAQGIARRFGAVFDSRRLGYDSTLCAVDVTAPVPDRAAAPLVAHPGVTHCYERDGRPGLWFTLTAPRERLAAERERLAAALRPAETLDLPARRTFKIEAIFDPRLAAGEPGARHARRPRAEPAGPPPPLNAREREVVCLLQVSLPLVMEPFAALSAQLGWTESDLLDLLTRWHAAGILRRIGVIVRHRELGFAANAMCVWNVAADRIPDAGRRVAGFPEVTHCYERAPHARFPYNLFAMVHADSRANVLRSRDRIAAAAGLDGGLALVSTREIKKTSPVYFAPDESQPGPPWAGHSAQPLNSKENETHRSPSGVRGAFARTGPRATRDDC